MTNTLENALSTSITRFFVEQVAQHLSEWLKNNNEVNVSTEELCAAFNITYTPRTTLPQAANISTQYPNMPGYMTGTGTPPSRGRRGRRNRNIDPNAPKCVYIFKRGNNLGKTCSVVVAAHGPQKDDYVNVAGSDKYCRNCLKKRAVKESIKRGSNDRMMVNPPTIQGSVVEVSEQKTESNSMELNCMRIEGSANMLKDIEDGFIIENRPDCLVALEIEKDGVRRPLTSEEKELAQMKGLSVIGSPRSPKPKMTMSPKASPKTNSPQVTVPQIPQMNGVNGINGIEETNKTDQTDQTNQTTETSPKVSVPDVPQVAVGI